MKGHIVGLLCLALLGGCGDSSTGGAGGTGGSGGVGGSGGSGGDPGPPDTLSEWALFEDAPNQVPAEGVIPYDLISPLFSDFALKHRFMRVPDGETIAYSDDQAWEFPVGSILIKTFAYPVDERDPELGEQLIETRLMVHEEDGWTPLTYVWNEAQTEAFRETGGSMVSVTWIDEEGDEVTHDNYGIPSTGQCRKCHGTEENTTTLGPKTGQLNRLNDYGDGEVNQIDHFATLELFDVAPPAAEERSTFDAPDSEAPVEDRARAYMDANCGSCHSPVGEEQDKDFYLDYVSTDPATGTDPNILGICREPSSGADVEACNQAYDVVPGSPEDSFMICRMGLVGTGQMPPEGRNLIHQDGIDLVTGWVNQLDPVSCPLNAL